MPFPCGTESLPPAARTNPTAIAWLDMRCQRCSEMPTRVAIVAVLLGDAGCATVPQVHTAAAPGNAVPVEISGVHGPLSPRDAQAVLARLAAAAPNAGILERHLAVEEAVAESPLFTGNRVRILQDGQQTFPALFEAIRNARHYVDLEYYIFEDVSSDGTLLSDLLIARRQAGLEINVIYDAVGSIATSSDFLSRLQAAGVRLVQFNPLNPLKSKAHYSIDDRDHRKMLIADGELVILGGVNLSSTYESAPQARASKRDIDGTAAERPRSPEKFPELWRDIDVEISGPVVPEFEKLYRQHWSEQQGPSLVEGKEPAQVESRGQEVVRIVGSTPSRSASSYYVTVLSAIRNAERTLWVTAAYFVPTHQEKQDLMRAARRGIDVRLLVPSHSDSPPALAVQHSHYTDLLEAGVKIYERDEGVLHSKSMVIDTVWSIIGSSNFDQRSVLFNDEVDAVIIGKVTGEQLENIFQKDLQHAHSIDLASWKRRTVGAKLREQFWRRWQKLL
jgi:cardiolipin synthase